MTHIRRQVREAVATLLLAAGGATDPAPWEGRVYMGKRWRWQTEGDAAQVPGVAIYTDAERVTMQDFGRAQSRTIAVLIELAATPDGDEGSTEEALEDRLDLMQERVEEAIGRDNRLPTVGHPDGLVMDLSLQAVATGIDADGNVLVAIRRMTWAAEAWTTEGAPDVAIGP